MAKKTQTILAADITVDDRFKMLGMTYVVTRAESGFMDMNKRAITARPEEFNDGRANITLMIKDLMPVEILKRK